MQVSSARARAVYRAPTARLLAWDAEVAARPAPSPPATAVAKALLPLLLRRRWRERWGGGGAARSGKHRDRDRVSSCILDGEIVALNAHGASSFSKLKAELGAGRSEDLQYYLFHYTMLLFQQHHLPLQEHKKIRLLSHQNKLMDQLLNREQELD